MPFCVGVYTVTKLVARQNIEQKSYSLELLQRPDCWKPWKMVSTLHKLLSDTNVSWFSSRRSKQNLDILIISTLYKIVRDVFLHFRYLQNVQISYIQHRVTCMYVCMYYNSVFWLLVGRLIFHKLARAIAFAVNREMFVHRLS